MRVGFQYNPEEYTVSREAKWDTSPQKGAGDGSTARFKGVTPRSLETFTFILDFFAIPPALPQITIAKLEAAMEPTAESLAANVPMPSKVVFGWGPNIVMQDAYITSLKATYKRFLPTGEPSRAEVSITLAEAPSVLPATNPTSGGIASRRTHTVVEGDTLASVAYKEFKNATKWRALAEANGIDDPMRLLPGTVLLVPEPSEVDALA
jgi:nucleoid-associated protein YgaU